MSIRSIIRFVIVVSGFSLGLTGLSWGEEPAANDKGDASSAESAPPADADDGASGEPGEAGDAGTSDTDKD